MTKKFAVHKNRRGRARASSQEIIKYQKGIYMKEKKIYKVGRSKETDLSEIQLEIVDMFSRSYTNGQIGVKFPQQKYI